MTKRFKFGMAVSILLAAPFFSPSQRLNGQISTDFLFREPRVSIAVNMGYGMAMAGSDLFDQVITDLTLEKRDFHTTVIGGAFSVALNSRVDLSFDVNYANSSTLSEFRDWVDMDDLPIEQRTRFTRIPVTMSLKGFLWDRGRKISRFAWVPGTWSPFVGIGGGKVYYEFKQNGDFVDFETLDVFNDYYESNGNANIFHVLGGAQVSLGPRFFLTGEGRYSWADAEMSTDFVGFEPIDLSGFQATVGLAVRF